MDNRIIGAACLVLVVAAIVHQGRVAAYNILMIPIPGRSHLFSMAAVAEGLAGRGHRVSLLIGKHFPADHLPEVGNSSSLSITVVRYSDTCDGGVTTDYEATYENVATHAMVQRVDMWSLIPIIRNRCAAAGAGISRGKF